MIHIDDELRALIDNALDDRCPISIGTVSADGEPQISMKGSVLVFDRETLAYWERAALRLPTSSPIPKWSSSIATPSSESISDSTVPPPCTTAAQFAKTLWPARSRENWTETRNVPALRCWCVSIA